MSFEIIMGKYEKKSVLCYYMGSLYGRPAPDCANYLSFDSDLTPVKSKYGHKHIL